MQETIAKALRQFEQYAALTELAPGLLQQFQAMQAGLAAAIETQGLQAFDEAIRKNALEPLQQLADAYGMTKEARDADQGEHPGSHGGRHAVRSQTKALAQTIRDVAAAEAMLPELRRQAALSAPAAKRRSRPRKTKPRPCRP